MTEQLSDHRDAAFLAIFEAMDRNGSIALLTNDMGAHGLSKLVHAFPDRVLNVGIQEQNLVSVASGLSLSYVRPIIFGISAHLVGRAYEQFRLDLAYSNVDALVLAAGPGLTYGVDGPTHQAVHEAQLVSTLPNTSYHMPSHPTATYNVVRDSFDAKGIWWVSLDKLTFNLADHGGVSRDSWTVLESGTSTCVVTYGAVAELAFRVAERFGITILLLERPFPLPLDVLEYLTPFSRVLFVEEAVSPGILAGQYGAVVDRPGDQRRMQINFDVNTPLGPWTRQNAWSILEERLVTCLSTA